MTAIDTILERMNANGDKPALFYQGRLLSYREFDALIKEWDGVLLQQQITQNTICAFVGDYSPNTCALIFALMKAKAVLVPFTRAIEKEIPEFLAISGADVLFRFNEDDAWTLEKLPASEKNDLLVKFRERDHPGLIVFSSGSTGKPKGIVQDCENVMKKFVEPRKGWRTVLFLLMDHFGGFNTLLSSFAYGGVGVCLKDRMPESVCLAIQQSKADLLPTTPTFINFLIASKCYETYDLSSVELITYGTEVMTPATLKKLREIFPNAQVKQTYGLSELGVLRSKSESDDSVWVKIGGVGFETKIVDNTLWIRSEANMVGYLNAPNPFDEEGWMNTGDLVEVKGDYMRILGRKSDMINVGGQKVFPAEVESVLLEDDNVAEVSVFGKPHPVMGNVVHARLSIIEPENFDDLVTRLRKLCLTRLAKHKVPIKFILVENDQPQYNARFKKVRKEQ